jgi:hypothetical protein
LGGLWSKNMKRDITPDELKKEILVAFPEGTGDLFYELWTNVAHLHLKWKNYRSLFGTSPDRIDLLNEVASLFFGLLDGILLHDVVLAIARLTDPAWARGKKRKDNASFERLLEMLNPDIDANLTNELKSELDDLKAHCKSIRQLRDRLIAHDDLATALQYRADPLPDISRAYIEDILERVRNLLGKIEEHFLGSPTSHEQVISINDAESLVFALESAREHESCRRREFNQKYGFNVS